MPTIEGIYRRFSLLAFMPVALLPLINYVAGCCTAVKLLLCHSLVLYQFYSAILALKIILFLLEHNNNISNFITNEKEGKGFWGRFFYQAPKIFPTKEFAYDINLDSLNDEIEIKPSPFRNFLNWVIALFFFFAAITVTVLFIAANIPIGIAGIVVCIIVYVVMMKPLLKVGRLRRSRLPNPGISVNAMECFS